MDLLGSVSYKIFKSADKQNQTFVVTVIGTYDFSSACVECGKRTSCKGILACSGDLVSRGGGNVPLETP